MEATVEYAPATGVLSGIWLLVAIPLASAAVLLLLGKRADKWATGWACCRSPPRSSSA